MEKATALHNSAGDGGQCLNPTCFETGKLKQPRPPWESAPV